MTYAGNGVITAEGVTLSGVRKDEDCILTELWRRPPRAGAEGASVKAQTLRQKDKDQLLSMAIFVFLMDRAFCAIHHFFIRRRSYGKVS